MTDYRDTLPHREREEWLAARDADPFAPGAEFDEQPTAEELAADEREARRADVRRRMRRED